MLQCVAVGARTVGLSDTAPVDVLRCVAVQCSVLQCVAVCARTRASSDTASL